ncbi:MAG: hypothetical protein OEV42_18095 [Deltaproteobacteria bacterium]|nr:hypothetical protein [Deltaproteobacteria bacterium]
MAAAREGQKTFQPWIKANALGPVFSRISQFGAEIFAGRFFNSKGVFDLYPVNPVNPV